ITAIATASTTNCTKRMISRVNKKNRATMPTIPRNSGPKSPCRYDTRPFVLSARGAVATSDWIDISLLRGKGIAVEQQARTITGARDQGCPPACVDGAIPWTYQVPCCLTMVSAYAISRLAGEFSVRAALPGCPGIFQTTVATMCRTSPPAGVVTLLTEPNTTDPPRPVTVVPGARNRPRVDWSPLA